MQKPTNYAGAVFAQNFSACMLIAPEGHYYGNAHYYSPNLLLGFSVQSPHILYPDHHHIAQELYITLFGKALWRKGQGGFVERDIGEVIFHSENENHAMQTKDNYLITLYAWAGNLDCYPVVPKIAS